MGKNQGLPAHIRERNRKQAVRPRKYYEPLWSRTHESNGVNHRRANFQPSATKHELDLINRPPRRGGHRQE